MDFNPEVTVGAILIRYLLIYEYSSFGLYN